MERSDLEILIVEDDPVISTDLRSFLTSEHFQVVGATARGEKALDLLATRHPNFAILDIHLGRGVSGLDIAEVIHDNYHIPYIFLTSFSDIETMQLAQSHGPYGYLVKPFQEQTLISTITTAWHQFQRMQDDKTSLVADISHLTTQEQKICKELLKGDSYKQICASLFISLNTLKYHIKNIYQKMEVSSRSELSNRLLLGK